MSLTLALALVVGGMLGTGTAVVLDLLDQRIRSLDELRRLTGLAVLGQVALLPGRRSGAMGPIGLISYAKPNSYWAEAYRAIRTNIDFRRRNQRLQVLLVTSPYSGDGKTTAASNLAISFALAGRRVLLIDADLRRPSLDKVHGLSREHGLSHLLQDLLPLHQVVQRSKIENLEVITVDPEVSNPDELLSSPRLKELLDEARQATMSSSSTRRRCWPSSIRPSSGRSSMGSSWSPGPRRSGTATSSTSWSCSVSRRRPSSGCSSTGSAARTGVIAMTTAITAAARLNAAPAM